MLQATRGSSLLTRMLVNTIAHANKFGAPEHGLREDSLRVARYMVDDLVRVSVDASDKRSVYIAGVEPIDGAAWLLQHVRRTVHRVAVLPEDVRLRLWLP